MLRTTALDSLLAFRLLLDTDEHHGPSSLASKVPDSSPFGLQLSDIVAILGTLIYSVRGHGSFGKWQFVF